MVCMGIPNYKIIYDYDGCSRIERYCSTCLEKEKENDEYSVVVYGLFGMQNLLILLMTKAE